MLTGAQRLCTRCRNPVAKLGARWPEGRICRRCYQQATRLHGRCPGCSTERLLPGRDQDGAALCVDCAGIPTDFRCTRCSEEDEPHRNRICARCCLREDLAGLLDDGSGTIPEALRPLHQGLCNQPRPRSALTWLRNPDVRELLTTIATSTIPPTHAAFDNHHSPHTAMHLRGLFIRYGLLEPADTNLILFQAWLEQALETIENPRHRSLIRRFAIWHHLRRLRNLSAGGKLQWGSVLSAQQDIRLAAAFLHHLDARGQDPSGCRQADIDHWLATGPTTRSSARTFVHWAIRNKQLPPVKFPHRKARNSPVLDQDERLRLLGGVLKNGDRPLHYRAAAILLLLYAQPITRIAAMTCEQIQRTDNGEATVTFNGHPVPVPHPFDEILLRHLAHRPNMNTAANHSSPWLFPGYRPGQHLHPGHLTRKILDSGIHMLGARNATLRALVLAMPPPLVAHALGYNTSTTEQHAMQSGRTWATYASHKRQF